MPTDYSTVLGPIVHNEDPLPALQFLQGKNLLANNQTCGKCHADMKFSRYNSKDRWGWNCPHRNCKSSKSVRDSSWFYNMRIPIQKALHLIYLWSIRTPVCNARKMTDVSEKSIIQIYRYLRDIASWKLMQVMNGNREENQEILPSYRNKSMWDNCYGGEDSFDNILIHIAERYPVV